MDYDAAANYFIMNQQCKVCDEPAAGYHFGAFTCEGCKSFFGRSYNNMKSIGSCKNNGKCIINKKNRTSCKFCRLKKCVMVGMSKSGSRYGRRSNWFKIHCLMQQQHTTLENQRFQEDQFRRSFELLEQWRRGEATPVPNIPLEWSPIALNQGAESNSVGSSANLLEVDEEEEESEEGLHVDVEDDDEESSVSEKFQNNNHLTSVPRTEAPTGQGPSIPGPSTILFNVESMLPPPPIAENEPIDLTVRRPARRRDDSVPQSAAVRPLDLTVVERQD